MCRDWSQSSPSAIRAYDSASVTLDSRSDFTSEPSRTKPASYSSRISKSRRARRLVATTLVRPCSLLGPGLVPAISSRYLGRQGWAAAIDVHSCLHDLVEMVSQRGISLAIEG